MKITGGSFQIPDQELEDFYQVYCTHVFKEHKKEYLTEKQHDTGPVLVDLDFRYPENTERVHTEDDIVNILYLYLNTITELVNVEENASFPVYFFQKPNVNKLADKTKDGIHMVIGLHMEREVQIALREKVVKKIGDTCPGLGKHLINTWDNVVDAGIAKGTVNWQLFGSRKPGHEHMNLLTITQ